MLLLTSNLTELKGVGPTVANRLTNLGLSTVNDLLWHFPSRYEDFSHLVNIANLKLGERITVKGKVQLINTRRSWKRRLTITEALIKDNTGSIKAIWFNTPYLATSIKPGAEVMLAGTLTAGNYGLQMEHPTIEAVATSGIHTGRLVPIYPSSSLLSQRLLRNLISHCSPSINLIKDYLPIEIISKFKLLPLAKAVYCLHFPATLAELTAARRRVTFDELFLIHLKSLLARKSIKQTKAESIPFQESTKQLVAALPWTLTADQRQATWEIIKDLGKPSPMYRLLQGDVGSGKTIVAGIASFNCVRSNLQTAILAPTEILAQQHFNTLSKLLAPWSITSALLTRGHHRISSSKENISASLVKEKIKSGSIDLVIGTQTLLQSSVEFKKLGLVIVDEQHRFGVMERQALIGNRTPAPHLLSMTATPIPRSLALTLYGDLDISVIKSLPPGRLPITTKLILPNEREQAYKLMQQEVAKGNRVFIVCPLIEESDNLGVRAATTEHTRLQKNIFPSIKLGLLHGKLSSKEKTQVMNEFKTGQAPILISTSVIEVGIDVPEATIMAVEGAERFGLAQLHQFRGRIGRSERPSVCLLMTDSNKPNSLERLKALTKYSDGFSLAEFDLSHRGPGDLIGQTQSGFLKLRFAELADFALLKTIRDAATLIFNIDPELRRWPELINKAGTIDFHPE